MSEEGSYAYRNQQGMDIRNATTDTIYSRAGRIVYTYSKAVLGIVFGAFYFHECPAQEKVPIALITCFSIILLTYLMNLPQDMGYILNSNDIEKLVCFRCLDAILHVVLIGVFFAECYWIFSMRPDTEDRRSENYCDFIFYHVSFWGTTLMLIMTVISIPMYVAIYCAIDS